MEARDPPFLINLNLVGEPEHCAFRLQISEALKVPNTSSFYIQFVFSISNIDHVTRETKSLLVTVSVDLAILEESHVN